jgi:predicted CXXCH cytochrome family protein
MNRISSWLLMATLAATMLVSLGAEMADTMSLKADGGTSEAVTLEHRKHSMERGIACTKCHHNMATEGTKRCAECHTLPGSGETPKLEDAYHGLCQGCHKEPPEGTKPPTDCEACHVPKG